MVLALKDKWLWDFWLAQNGEDWHIYFLQADNRLADPEMRHRNVTQGHAVSKNLIDWVQLGTCFAPSPSPAWDDWTTWTGCVIQGHDKQWHLFYTGTAHAGGGLHQRIGHATSQDMHSWERVGNGLALDLTGPLSAAYEEYSPGHWPDRAMRDPWVMKNPDGEGWIMYFTARTRGHKEPNAGGAIGFATSTDLYKWDLAKPVYTGGDFGQLEVPQVFKYAEKWYMIFCTAAEHWSDNYKTKNQQVPVTGTHYLVADHHLGPWQTPPGKFLDGHFPCQRYAGKVVERAGKLSLMAFRYYDESGNFVGQISDPIAITVDEMGLLKLEK